jgi:hypothetical protein
VEPHFDGVRPGGQWQFHLLEVRRRLRDADRLFLIVDIHVGQPAIGRGTAGSDPKAWQKC